MKERVLSYFNFFHFKINHKNSKMLIYITKNEPFFITFSLGISDFYKLIKKMNKGIPYKERVKQVFE